MGFRTGFGDLNSFVLDSLQGLSETIQYGRGEDRKEQMTKRSEKLSGFQKELSALEGAQKSSTNLVILGCSLGMLFLTLFLYGEGGMKAEGVLMSTLAMMGSFGPVAALSSLSNNLNQTLASAERVLSILEEKPMVEVILEEYSLLVKPGRIVGIHGASGSGKSTLLKLFMRFWDVDAGRVMVSGMDVKDAPTRRLRDMESYVTQSTWLFHDTIANNIAVGKPGASMEEIMEAAKKASVHDFIMTLPKGYDTEVGELGDTLSGGERQRIGIARAFLHDAPFVLLDEPTSNLDALNEGVILKSLKEERGQKTMILVSHRRSTMNIAEEVYEMANGRIS